MPFFLPFALLVLLVLPHIPIPIFCTKFNISTTNLHKSITLPTASAYFCAASLEPGEFLAHRKVHFFGWKE